MEREKRHVAVLLILVEHISSSKTKKNLLVLCLFPHFDLIRQSKGFFNSNFHRDIEIINIVILILYPKSFLQPTHSIFQEPRTIMRTRSFKEENPMK